MTLDELLEGGRGRMPTGADLYAAAVGLGWRVDPVEHTVSGPSKSDPLYAVVKKLLARDPWRSEFIAAAESGPVAIPEPEPKPEPTPERHRPTRAELMAVMCREGGHFELREPPYARASITVVQGRDLDEFMAYNAAVTAFRRGPDDSWTELPAA